MNICILGTGKMAMAIGYLLEKNGMCITFCGRDLNQLEELDICGTNSKYTTHCFDKTKISVQHCNFTLGYPDISRGRLSVESATFLLTQFRLIFYCLPTSLLEIVEHIEQVPIVFTCKGLEKNKLIIDRCHNYCILSGCSYATEILNNIPCYLTLSSSSDSLNKNVYGILHSNNCILKLNNDPFSIEYLSILKNIIAVFSGIINALRLGKNIESAFICKVLEIVTINIIGIESFLSPAGFGDIFLSCSPQSINYTHGVNMVLNKYVDTDNTAVEGIKSLRNLLDITQNDQFYNIIVDMCAIIDNIKNIDFVKNKILQIIKA